MAVATVSTDSSGRVLAWMRIILRRLGHPGLAEHLTMHIVRKLAHFCEYTLEGFLLMLCMRVYSRHPLRHITVPMLGGVLTALTDETIQLFSGGTQQSSHRCVAGFCRCSGRHPCCHRTAVGLRGTVLSHKKETRMTIQQANQYFAALPDGFCRPAPRRTAARLAVQQVQFVGVAGTAGKTAVARLLAAILHAQGIRAGVYHAGCEPLAARIRVDGKPVDEALLCRAADALAAHEELPLVQAAELVAAAYCFGEAGCTLAVVELPDAGLCWVCCQKCRCAPSQRWDRMA